MNTTSLRSLLQQAGEALDHAALHPAETEVAATGHFIVRHEQTADRQLRRAQTLATLAVAEALAVFLEMWAGPPSEADDPTFDARAAREALLAWSWETGLPLPGHPDLIVALEAAGHTVDLETGRVILFGAERPLAQVLTDPGLDLARAVQLLDRDPGPEA